MVREGMLFVVGNKLAQPLIIHDTILLWSFDGRGVDRSRSGYCGGVVII